MENPDKEQINPDLSADNSDQELTNNIDGTKSAPESEMMSDDGEDNLETNNSSEDEQNDKVDESNSHTQMTSQLADSDLPHDIANDETPPMSEMPKNYEKLSKKEANSEWKDE